MELWRTQLTDIWKLCPGMLETAQRERPKTAAMRATLQKIFEDCGPPPGVEAANGSPSEVGP